jgi:hypothetical protein
MSKRELAKPFIDEFMRFTENVETPSSFNLWTAISTMASVLQRKVWVSFKQFGVTFYPPLYIVLTSPPGVCRKGTIIRISEDLLRNVEGVHLLANDITREKMLRDMAKNMTKTTMDDGEVYAHASSTCIAEEFSTLLGIKDIPMLATLTALWNCDPLYRYHTKTQGSDTLTNIGLNVLAGTTPDWIASSLPQEALGGGFTSRIVFVCEGGSDKVAALTDPIPDLDPALAVALAHDLNHIAKNLVGEFTWSDRAGGWYSEWYREFRGEDPSVGDHRFQHYFARKPTMLWKVAMCISASESDDMVIEEHHLLAGEGILSALEPKMPIAFGGLGKSEFAGVQNRVLQYIRTSPGVTERQLWGLVMMDLKNRDEFIMIISNLLYARLIISKQKVDQREFYPTKEAKEVGELK